MTIVQDKIKELRDELMQDPNFQERKTTPYQTYREHYFLYYYMFGDTNDYIETKAELEEIVAGQINRHDINWEAYFDYYEQIKEIMNTFPFGNPRDYKDMLLVIQVMEKYKKQLQERNDFVLY